MQMKGGKKLTLHPGQTFYEDPNGIHLIGRNTSDTKPANFLVLLVKDTDAHQARDFAEAHSNLGFTLRQQGPQNYTNALEHYNRAIQLKPNMAETYEYRGVLFAKMGKKADAERDLAALKKLNPKLAGELAEFLKTGEEEDEYAPTSPKQKS
jgi:tetratricopeptide (TPR) repeat protein